VTTGDEVDYDRWYPEVPAVMDTKQLAELLHTNDQIIRAWVREGVIPAHRRPGGRKFTFLRHEIFDWLIANRYRPNTAE
jgi:excisionase family DNA binding protein